MVFGIWDYQDGGASVSIARFTTVAWTVVQNYSDGKLKMDEIIKAIIARYLASEGATLRTATPGGMWLSQAPSTSPDGTFIVLTPLPMEMSAVMNSTAETGDGIVRFNVMNTAEGSDSLVITAAIALRALYHDVIMTLGTGFEMKMSKFVREDGPTRDPDSMGYMFIRELRFIYGR